MSKLTPRATVRSNALLGIEPPPKLSPAHANVLDIWFANGCLSRRQALIAAGYTGATLVIFQRPEVIEEIERRRSRLTEKQQLTEDRIIAEYEKIAFASLGNLLEIQSDGSAWIDVAAMTQDQKDAMLEYESITSQGQGDEDGNPGKTIIKSKIKFHDKKAALDSLARIKGMFKDKLEVSVGLSLGDKVQRARERIVAQKTITQEGETVNE